MNAHQATRRNLELKVRVTSDALATLRAMLAGSAGHDFDIQRQEDRYFRVPEGRLKLRTITTRDGASRAELIAYRRPDESLSRWSAYRITSLAAEQSESLAGTLEQVLPVLVVVRKRREIIIHGATRIHLDEVEGLGAFVELETVVKDQSEDEAVAEHQTVIEMLNLDRWPSCAGSYSDLLLRAAMSVENEKQGT
jgi:predicted adenylyl cyclase CyaB